MTGYGHRDLLASVSAVALRPAGEPWRFRSTSELISTLTPDVPVLCYSAAALTRQVLAFRAGFRGEVTFAVKACPLPLVLDEMVRAGVSCFDVASPEEMALVRRSLPTARLHYNNPVKSRAEITEAYEQFGVTHFTVDDAAELAKIRDLVPASRDIEIAVRFKLELPGALYPFHSKFGATAEDAQALLEAADAAGYAVSLSFHPGSQTTQPAAFAAHIELAAQIAARAGVRLAQLNVGGGFPAPYSGSDAAPLADFFAAIAVTADHAFAGNPPKLIAEPGRALVAQTMSLITRVKHRRPSGELFINDGTYGALMELMLVDIKLPTRVFDESGRQRRGPGVETTVFGPTCDSFDRIPGTLLLPAGTGEGDWIEFGLAGAYSVSTTTRFNGYGDLSLVEVEEILTV